MPRISAFYGIVITMYPATTILRTSTPSMDPDVLHGDFEPAALTATGDGSSRTGR